MSNASGTPIRPSTVAATAQIGAGSLVPVPNGFGTPVRPATVAATVEIGAIRWVTDPVGISDAIDVELVPGRDRRALVQITREEWTPVHVQVLCWRIVTACIVGLVLEESFLPLWLAGDPQALPILLDVLALWYAVDRGLRRRLP